MIYESIAFRPSSGVVDVEAITAWLASRDDAFLDAHGVWHLCGDKQALEQDRLRERGGDPSRFPHCTLVGFFEDTVWISAYCVGLEAERAALAFVRWLCREGEWTVKRDWGAFEPLGDPGRLFPPDIEIVDTTIVSLTEGVRHEWRAPGRMFIVHSSGQFRGQIDDHYRRRGFLTEAALRTWNATVATVTYPDDPCFYIHPEHATGQLDVEDAEGIESAWFDAADIPAQLRPLAALVDQWLDEIARWRPGSESAIIVRFIAD